MLKGAGTSNPSLHWRSGLTQEVTVIPQAPFQSQTQVAAKDRWEKTLLREHSYTLGQKPEKLTGKRMETSLEILQI